VIAVDTSALVAILLGEAEPEACAAVPEAEDEILNLRRPGRGSPDRRWTP
jgi:hypothetical protein